MSLENKTALSNHRLKKAEEALSDAKMLVDAERYSAAANRSYYAIFYAIRAVLALDGIDRKHHSAVIAEFRKLYIKTGVFDSSLSDIIGEEFPTRLSLPERGAFQLGYYHQQQKRYEKKENN